MKLPILLIVVALGAALTFSSAHGDGPTADGQAFAVLVATQNKIEEDLRRDRFDAESTRSSIQRALPAAFVYVSSTGIVFLSLENEMLVVLEPKVDNKKAVAWNCATRGITGSRNQERAARLRCAKLVATGSHATK